jgi:hypothetical protein
MYSAIIGISQYKSDNIDETSNYIKPPLNSIENLKLYRYGNFGVYQTLSSNTLLQLEKEKQKLVEINNIDGIIIYSNQLVYLDDNTSVFNIRCFKDTDGIKILYYNPILDIGGFAKKSIKDGLYFDKITYDKISSNHLVELVLEWKINEERFIKIHEPSSPVYAPTSPRSEDEGQTDTYVPTSPVYAPTSPGSEDEGQTDTYVPTSPVYAPTSPRSEDEGESKAYAPTSPRSEDEGESKAYAPTSPRSEGDGESDAYVPSSPVYAPTSQSSEREISE